PPLHPHREGGAVVELQDRQPQWRCVAGAGGRPQPRLGRGALCPGAAHSAARRRIYGDEGGGVVSMSESDEIFREIERIEGCERTKSRCLAVLKTMLGRRVYFARKRLERDEQVRAAVALLQAGRDRTEAHKAIMARFG